MNVFSLKSDPLRPITLTEKIYNDKTKRDVPYVQRVNGDLRSFALCPGCQNPTVLVNRTITQTEATVLYAKHTGYDVKDVAEHNEAAYLDCPLANPERFDSKKRRTSKSRNDELRQALLNHLHLVIASLEEAIEIKFTDAVVESMVRDFGDNKGYEYKAINLFNLPFGFAYMTEAKDLYGCRVKSDVAQAIAALSKGFITRQSYGSYTVLRNPQAGGTKIRFYFNNHRMESSSMGKDSIDFCIVEMSTETDQSVMLFKKRIEFECEKFFNTFRRRERFRLLAQKYI